MYSAAEASRASARRQSGVHARGGVPKPRDGAALRVLQVNVNGWRGRALALNRLLEKSRAHVCVLLETKLTAAAPPPVPRGWSLAARRDRTVHRGGREVAQGGVAILVKQGVRHAPLHSAFPLAAPIECVGARVVADHIRLDVWALYRPPVRGGAADSRDQGLFLDHWPAGRQVLLCSDINAHSQTWELELQRDWGLLTNLVGQ